MQRRRRRFFTCLESVHRLRLGKDGKQIAEILETRRAALWNS
jgi:hypothetical protein